MSAQTWDDFAAALAGELAALTAGETLLAGGVRCDQRSDRLTVDTGDRRVETPWPLTTARYRELADLAVTALRGEDPATLGIRVLHEELRPEGGGDSMAALHWEAFAQALAEEFADLPHGALVVISERVGNRFAQFAQEDDRLYAEVTAACFMPEEQRTSPEGERAIEEAGWRSREGDNWWVELPWPGSSQTYRELAGMVTGVLGGVFGIAGPDALHYRAWNERDGNDEFELPRLRLPWQP
ncbi:TY-Chap domain-containing protein [Actinomadura macrotermitis]|uniref:TY-Chap N-terminal domain-containing protein n=1 Tax=Actinomadura macrotermitis TaxID=2585200 RepID=A0A7K0C6P3_9ACTN|nr:hypothetical protein [Actinomadura macrotermitis]MQY08464.1 hypothetical protein [Actinomadura macrotermitis]